MKRFGTILCLLLAALLCLSGCRGSGPSVQEKITAYLEEQLPGDENNAIKLSDFTDFPWDQVCLFQYPTSAEELENALGVRYEGPLDLTAGMIFVSEGTIVSDEIFPDAYTTKFAPLLIYPQEDLNAEPRYRVFSPETAVFRWEKVVYSPEISGYRLYPTAP